MAYLLLLIAAASLVYIGWRLARVSGSQSKTRVIGPDDDPDFLRRLGHGDNPARLTRVRRRELVDRRAPAKSDATTAASSISASRVPGLSRSRLISAPSSRCGSNGTSRTARQRREKWSTTLDRSTLPERGRTALITAMELRTRS